MGDIISLKLKRKDKSRQAREAEATAKRAQFGRTKADKKLAEATQDQAARKLDGHKRDDDRQ
jgi:hypothetical protein